MSFECWVNLLNCLCPRIAYGKHFERTVAFEGQSEREITPTSSAESECVGTRRMWTQPFFFFLSFSSSLSPFVPVGGRQCCNESTVSVFMKARFALYVVNNTVIVFDSFVGVFFLLLLHSSLTLMYRSTLRWFLQWPTFYSGNTFSRLLIRQSVWMWMITCKPWWQIGMSIKTGSYWAVPRPQTRRKRK